MTLATRKRKRRTHVSAARVAVQTIAAPPDRSGEVRSRIRALLASEIAFVPNRCFHESGAEAKILRQPPAGREETRFATWPRDLPAHLARLCESALLPAEVEADLFRRMNYLKSRVHALRTQLNPDRPNRRALAAAERFLAEATAIRNRIIRANMRLVIAIIKKFVGPQHSFDDLLSDGTMSLMHAVDKFDYARGFRFSTYAYRAIARNAYRAVLDRQKENSRFGVDPAEALFAVADDRMSGGMSEQTWSLLRNQLAAILERLDRREQLIIRARFALGAHRKVRTFQSLAERLGISKERVRQLQQLAIDKLRQLVSERGAE